MRIELNWNNANPVIPATIDIYRCADTEILADLSNGVLIASVDHPRCSYLDGDVEEGRTYYYRFKSRLSGYKSVLSENFSFTASPTKGPGKHILHFGDEAFGIFGIVQPAPDQLPTYAEIRTMLGLPFVARDIPDHYYKYAVGGQIAYFPSIPACLLNELPNGNGIADAILAGTPYEFEWGMWTYRLRLPEYVSVQGAELKLGEATRLLDAITDMYVQSRWIFPQGFKIDGKIDFEDTLSKMGPNGPWDLLTSLYKDPQAGTIVYRHYHENDMENNRIVKTLYLVQATEAELSQGIIWPVIELVGVTPRG